MGSFGDHWTVLVPAPCDLSGNLSAWYGWRLLCERIQKSYVSLRAYRTIVSDSRDSFPILRLVTHPGWSRLGGCSGWNRCSILAGVALFQKVSHSSLKIGAVYFYIERLDLAAIA